MLLVLEVGYSTSRVTLTADGYTGCLTLLQEHPGMLFYAQIIDVCWLYISKKCWKVTFIDVSLFLKLGQDSVAVVNESEFLGITLTHIFITLGDLMRLL